MRPGTLFVDLLHSSILPCARVPSVSAVADYSFARPDPGALKAAGYEGVMRYVAPDNPSTHGKLIFPPEYAALEAAGLCVTLNFEWTTTRANEGNSAGYDDAQTANQQAAALGYPTWRPVYFSVDESATVDTVRAYFQGVHSQSAHPVGFYGGQGVGVELMREGLVQYLWVANAASWSGFSSWDALRAAVAPEAHLIQHLDHPLGFDGQIDHNEVLRPDYAGAVMDPQLQADLEWLIATIKGVPTNVPNFLTDIHAAVANIAPTLAQAQSNGKAIAALGQQIAAQSVAAGIDPAAIARAVLDAASARLAN